MLKTNQNARPKPGTGAFSAFQDLAREATDVHCVPERNAQGEHRQHCHANCYLGTYAQFRLLQGLHCEICHRGIISQWPQRRQAILGSSDSACWAWG